MTHIVALRGDPSSGKLFVCIRLFGVMSVAVTWSCAEMPDRTESYAVDVLTGKEVSANVDVAMLGTTPWQATHQNGDPDLRRTITTGIEGLLTIARDRMFQAEVAALFERAMGPDETKPVTSDDIRRVVEEMTSFVLHEWERPTTTMEHRRDDVAGFDALCRKLERFVRPSERNAYGTTVQSERRRMEESLAQATIAKPRKGA
jgi:hypothetical protein